MPQTNPDPNINLSPESKRVAYSGSGAIDLFRRKEEGLLHLVVVVDRLAADDEINEKKVSEERLADPRGTEKSDTVSLFEDVVNVVTETRVDAADEKLGSRSPVAQDGYVQVDDAISNNSCRVTCTNRIALGAQFSKGSH